MEITIQQSDLAFAVGSALASVPAKSTLTILQSLLLEVQDGALRITGTDLDVTTSVTVPCAVKSGGRAAVQARHFSDAVRKLPRDNVRVADEDGGLTVFYAKGKSQVPRLDDQDFPMTPDVKPEGRISIDGPVLARLIQRTAYAVSSDETRAVLNGVYFAATDKVHCVIRSTFAGFVWPAPDVKDRSARLARKASWFPVAPCRCWAAWPPKPRAPSRWGWPLRATRRRFA